MRRQRRAARCRQTGTDHHRDTGKVSSTPRRAGVIRSSVVSRCATTTVKIGAIAFRIAACPDEPGPPPDNQAEGQDIVEQTHDQKGPPDGSIARQAHAGQISHGTRIRLAMLTRPMTMLITGSHRARRRR